MRTLIVIDMQNDFIDGSLGTKEAVSIVPNVKAKIEEYLKNGDRIIFTRDTHHDDYMDTNEGRHLPVVHCIEGTTGWEIRPELMDAVKDENEETGLVKNVTIINKPSFGFTGWKGYEFDEIELIGLCTDICVVSNALILKALFPEIKVSVDASCCAGVTPESHKAALETMKMCQIELI